MKGLREITLAVKRSQFRQDDPIAEHHDSDFKQVREEIKERDDFTCFYCGFKALKFQEVHHIDDNHSNNKKDNLTTICPLCHSCKHIGLAGLDERAFLIYYPNVLQVQINILIKMLWVGKDSNDEKIKPICEMILEEFDKLKAEADKKLTSDPAVLSTLLLEMNDEEYRKRKEKLKGFLLIPKEQHYKNQIRYWGDEVFKGTPASEWIGMAKKALTK